MEPPPKPSNSLFEVYLRLRPSNAVGAERFLDVQDDGTHITIKPPPTDHRKRAVEKFAFTQVFEEHAKQLDIFKGTGVVPLIEGVLAADGSHGRDGLLATLGVTGSGKSHTILGTKSQRGLTQMALGLLFQSTESQIVQPTYGSNAVPSLAATDASEAQLFTASAFLDSHYGDNQSERGFNSRAQTPMPEYSSFIGPTTTRSRNIPRPSALPQTPSVQEVEVPADPNAEYAIVISMYEVYNDRIFDLLSGSGTNSKNGQQKRRALLFKSTEQSPDRKVVAGLRKIICGSLDEALMVLETGLHERRVAGTGSNAVSSRSHGFFCVEVKKRDRSGRGSWRGSTLTIVDLAGSERARNAKTAGATLAEAGKINESLMYLGQCMQMQNDNQEGNKQNIVPFRQCKLTELLFSNSFPSATSHHHQQNSSHRNPQKAIMIVTADPVGDFNATSQILRYSALAREITVPRIPSVSSTILSGTTAGGKSTLSSGRSSPTVSWEELEQATQEVARLTEEADILAMQLDDERERRLHAEECWRAAEERMTALEQEIRDECFAEMEERMDAERRRWKGAWDEEADRADEHFDRKIEVLVKGIEVHEDEEGEAEGEVRVDELERENEGLKRKLELLEREVQGRSPSKKQRILGKKKWSVPDENLDSE
ncbi:kinesin family protein-like protein [Lophium mytilinum]|uniref:Kinesin-like protein n=1 Tax=Lophium mytilinum TaxID=390894 RepID=A0A6A6R993_9PEZI|nr:kinesin family protein-like protein [Lophium mytilinum]